MKKLIALLLVAAVLPTISSARIFRRVEDCTCTVPQKQVYNPYAALPPIQNIYRPTTPPIMVAAPKAQPKPVKALPVVAAPKPKLQKVAAVRGTAKMLNDAEAVYTLVFLPKSYQSCEPCLRIKQALERPTDIEIIKLRNAEHSRFKIYVEGDADFEHRWARRIPEVRQGKTVVLMIQGNKVLYKETNPSLVGFGGKLMKRFQDKICPKVCPNCPNPDDEPVPDEEEEIDIIPDTEPPILDTPEPDSDTPGLVLTAIGVAALAWFMMFKRGMG